eukprot:CAMPEP_0117573514 /NCGR_PEP_ID=MMETSP0784-20121206/61003_1 /TAXON_ID=39447 /ORGANISM="" /LENGTH=36 /DNA_ID= /DNA_START= /DNA_END= /DNA_ORIENTATION=
MRRRPGKWLVPPLPQPLGTTPRRLSATQTGLPTELL